MEEQSNFSFLQAYNNAIKHNDFEEAKRGFERYCYPQNTSRWQNLSLEQQQQFLEKSHQFIQSHYETMAKKLSAKDALEEAHLLYCQLIRHCVEKTKGQTQGVFYKAAGEFYAQQGDMQTALQHTLRAYQLSKDSRLEDIQWLETRISQLEITWHQQQGSALSVSVWENYFAQLGNIKKFDDSASVTKLRYECRKLQLLAEQLIEAGAWEKIEALYLAADKVICTYFEQLKKDFHTTYVVLREENSVANVEDFRWRVSEMEGFLQCLGRHHQWHLALAGYAYMLDDWKRNPLPALYDATLLRLENHELLLKEARNRNLKQNKLQPLPADYVPHWKTYQNELKLLRDRFRVGLNEAENLHIVQQQYSVGIIELFQTILAHIHKALGRPPTEFCLIAGGSLGRQSMAPYSDLDIALFIQSNKKEAAKENTLRQHGYWQRLLKLLQFYCHLLGERWTVEKNIVLQSCGITIDESDNKHWQGEAPLLIQSPVKFAQWAVGEYQQMTSPDTLLLSYGFLQSVVLYSSEPKSQLHHDYQQALIAGITDNAGKQMVCAKNLWEEVTTHIYKKIPEHAILAVPESLTLAALKTHYLKPLTYGVINIALFAEKRGVELLITRTPPSDLLNALIHTQRFHAAFLQTLQKALFTLEKLRCEWQFFHQGQIETALSVPALSAADGEKLVEIQQFVLMPLYEGIATLWEKENLPACIDPPKLLWENRLAQWWQAEGEARKALWPALEKSLACWLWHLKKRQAPIKSVQEQSYYDVLTDFHLGWQRTGTVSVDESIYFRSIMMNRMKKFLLPEEEIRDMENLLNHYPFPDGSRPALEEQEKAWQSQWQVLFSTSPAKEDSKLPNLKITYMVKVRKGKYQAQQGNVHPDIIQTLIQEKKLEMSGNGYRFVPKNKRANDISGRHNVFVLENIVIDGIAIGFYFKAFPEMPGMEQAAGALTRRLVGWGMPFTTLVRMHLADGDCPVLLSQTVTGKNLAEFPEEQLFTLDAEYYSQRVIVSHILQQEDAKAMNFVVEEIKEVEQAAKAEKAEKKETRLRLSSVDNDRSFYPAVIKAPKTEEFIPLVKDISYCFKQMQETFHPQARETFLVLEPYLVLQEWLQELQNINNIIHQLFTAQEIAAYFPQQTTVGMLKNRLGNWWQGSPTTSVLGVPLREGLITEIYHTLTQLRDSLVQNPQLTHAESLRHLQPLLAKYYLFYVKKYPDVSAQKRFRLAFKKYYGIIQSDEQVLAEKKATSQETTQSASWETLQTLYGSPVDGQKLLSAREQSVSNALKELEDIHEKWANLGQIKQQLLNADKGVLPTFAKLPGVLKAAIINAPDFDFGNIKKSADNQADMIYQEAILQSLIKTRTSFTFLKLVNCSCLATPILKELLNCSDFLESIDISGCINIDVQAFSYLAARRSLQKIKANGLTQLTELKMVQKGWQGKTWRGLKYFELQNCRYLKALQLDAPALTHLDIRGTPKLAEEKVQVKAEKLKKTLRGEVVEEENKKNFKNLRKIDLPLMKKSTSKDYDYLLKMVLLGDSCVGRGSCLDRFVYDTFRMHIPTASVRFIVQTIEIGDKKTKLHILNMPSQGRCRSLRTGYYPGAHVFFVLFDVTDISSFEHLWDWKNEIEEYGPPGIVIVLVGNKIDLVEERVVSSEMGLQLKEKIGADAYFECSAKTGKNVEEAFFTAARLVLEKNGIDVGRAVAPEFAVSTSSALEEPEYHFLFKMILVGGCVGGFVGKTQCLERFSKDSFHENDRSTLGMDFRIRVIEIGDKRIKLQMWDTPGQERYRPLISAYYRGAHVILLLFDVTYISSFEHLWDWKNEIEEHGPPESLIVLVGNKIDLVEKRVVSHQMGMQLAKEIGASAYFECSAKTGKNVEEAFFTAASLALKKINPEIAYAINPKFSLREIREDEINLQNSASLQKTHSENPVSTSLVKVGLFSQLSTTQLPLEFPPTARAWLKEYARQGGGAPVTRIDDTTLAITIHGTDIQNIKPDLLEEFAGYIRQVIGESNNMDHKFDSKTRELVVKFNHREITDEVLALLLREGFSQTPAVVQAMTM